jgi:hypothetical protein
MDGGSKPAESPAMTQPKDDPGLLRSIQGTAATKFLVLTRLANPKVCS